MAKKPLSFSALDEIVLTVELVEVRRESLYGSRQRVWLDEAGKPCSWGQITDDGLLVRAGMMGQTAAKCDDRPLVPSSHDAPPRLKLSGPHDLLNCAVEKVFALTGTYFRGCRKQALEEGTVFRTTYNLSATADPHDAFVLANEYGLWMLVGRVVEPEWIGRGDLPVMDDDDVVEEDDFTALV